MWTLRQSRPMTPLSSTPVVNKTVQMKYEIQKANKSLFWGAVNAVIFSIVFYDISYKCPYQSHYFYCGEVFVAVVLALNTVYHIARYVRNVVFLSPVELTPNQMRLMGVADEGPHFKSSVSPVHTSTCLSDSCETPMNLSSMSWLSSSMMSHSDGYTESGSMNFSTSSPSWVYIPGSPGASFSPISSSVTPEVMNASSSSQPISPPSFLNTSGEIIRDAKSLTKYLDDYQEQEKKCAVGNTMDHSSLLSSFWSHPASRTKPEVSPMLRRYTYQMAPDTPVTASGSPGSPTNELGLPKLQQQQGEEVWRHIGVTQFQLMQWNKNLRLWITQTILQRLENEITSVNDALHRQGLADIKVGGVGLERLKKTAQIMQVAQNIPTLGDLVPFLEVTSHQEYLVARIKELAKSGCMSSYSWSSGGTLHGKAWEDHLPTDAAIIMHLFAAYMDSQLPPLPNHDGKAFSNQHFVRTPEKPPKGQDSLVIYQAQIHPPHYVLIVGESTKEVSKGRNNLLHTILLFLYYVKTKEHGMLGRVNLGPSGINMMWIMDS